MAKLVPYASPEHDSGRDDAMRAANAYARTSAPFAEPAQGPSVIDAEYVEVGPKHPAIKASQAAKAADRIAAGAAAAFLLGLLIASVIGVPRGVAGVFASIGILLFSVAVVGLVSWMVAGPRR